MTELEAACLVRAALELLRDVVPGGGALDAAVSRWQADARNIVTGLEQCAPPWEPEPAASVTLPWSQVACGDSVQAPNGQWYPVDSIARLGSGAMSVLLIGPGGATVKSTPKAGDAVPVRRGPAGQAMDVLTAGGLELSLITSGAAA